MNVFEPLGFRFDPFEHLDAARDPYLERYFVIPAPAEIAWSESPVAILASPGGGKSALRVYTEIVYRKSLGVKFPITYVPDDFRREPGFHEANLKQATARSILIFLLSYPEVFLTAARASQKQVARLLSPLPFGLSLFAQMVQSGESIGTVEATLGVNALSGIQSFTPTHVSLMQALLSLEHPLPAPDWMDYLHVIKNEFSAKSIHILVDGLDGFEETSHIDALHRWIEPLLAQVNPLAGMGVYLKFFLPSGVIAHHPDLQLASLHWDDELLAALVRRRVYVATGEQYGSLDAISVPGLRDVELHIARQLPGDQKMPRPMIRQTRAVLLQALGSPDRLIHPKFVQKEPAYGYA